jgi:predicted Zn-dependent protease
LTISYDYIDKSHILYLKMISFNQLLRFAEESLEENKYYEADKYLLRAEVIKTGNPVAIYLRALYYIEVDNMDKAVSLLQNAISEGNIQPVFYLTLADIYQYKLNDIPSAITELEKYLLHADSPEVKQRLELLNSML